MAHSENRASAATKRVGAISSLALVAVLGFSQVTFGQGTSESFLKPLTGTLVFTGQAGTLPPPGADTTGIRLSRVTLSGALPEMQSANEAYEARLTGGTIRVSEIFDATADLQAAYHEAGYVLTQVVLPRQTLRNGGQLRAQVVLGMVEAVTGEVPAKIRPRVEQLTRPLVGDRTIQRSELERQLILAGEIPGTALEASLAPGAGQGGVVIDLAPSYQLFTGFVSYDNSLSELLGKDNLSLGVEFNSPFGLGEVFYGQLSGVPAELFDENPRTRTWSIGATIPVGSSGLLLNVEKTRTNGGVFADFSEFLSEYERETIRAIYPVIRSSTTSLTGQVSLDFVEETGYEVFCPTCGADQFFRDRLTVLRFNLSGSHTHEDGAVTEGGVTFSRGLDAFGARSLEEASFPNVPSRMFADATFSKLTAGISHRRELAQNVILSLGGRYQTSFGDALAASELVSIVGSQELSPFSSGALKGDEGWVARGELSTVLDVRVGQLPVAVSPYVFAATGEVQFHFPVGSERAVTSASAYGIGVDLFTKLDSAFRSGSLRIEYGKGMLDDSTPDENRLSVSGTLRF